MDNIEETNKNKYFLVIIILIFVVIILWFFILLIQKKLTSPKEEKAPVQPIPTKVENIFKVPTETPIPNLTEIQPATQTGVLEEELPIEEKILSEQKQALKEKLPLATDFFTIEFDYSEDKFIVNLKPPKATNQQNFIKWRLQNYPNIPLDRFIFK